MESFSLAFHKLVFEKDLAQSNLSSAFRGTGHQDSNCKALAKCREEFWVEKEIQDF